MRNPSLRKKKCHFVPPLHENPTPLESKQYTNVIDVFDIKAMSPTKSMKLCRLCGTIGEIIIPIFMENGIIAEKINKCLPLNVKKNDAFSKYICPRCLSALNVSYNLYVLSERVDKSSRKRLSRYEESEGICEINHEDYPNYPILEKSLRIVLDRLPDNINNENKCNNNDLERDRCKEEAVDEDLATSINSCRSEAERTEFETIFIKVNDEFLMSEDGYANGEGQRGCNECGGRLQENSSAETSGCKGEKNDRYNFRKKDDNYRKKIRDIIKLFESEDEAEMSKEEGKMPTVRKKMLTKKVAELTEKENGFSCSVCKKIFRHRMGLRKHMNLHSPRQSWQCSECKEKFPNAACYLKHQRIGHASHRTFACNICNSTFLRRSSMEAHKAARHHQNCFTKPAPV